MNLSATCQPGTAPEAASSNSSIHVHFVLMPQHISSIADPPDDPTGSFAALIAGDDVPIVDLEADLPGAERLAAHAALPAHAEALAATPRPDPVDGAHPARLLLHAIARQHRYDGASPDLGADYLEALEGCLARDASAWADIAGASWFQWLMSETEPSEGWLLATGVLARHRDRSLPPRMLASFSAMAERAGAIDVAEDLWQRARSHPDVAAVAAIRWYVEFEWARNHLMLAAGAPVRAAHVLGRVHAGLARFDDDRGRFAYLSAALELAFVTTLVGRPADALEVVARTRATLGADVEFDPWLSGVAALAHASDGDWHAARSALADVTGASTDTSSLDLAATVPASMIAHAGSGAPDAARGLARDIVRARSREAERAVDVEMRIIWRLFGALACLTIDATEEAKRLSAELDIIVAGSAAPVPAYATLAALVGALVAGDGPAEHAALDALAQIGVHPAPGSRDPWNVYRAPRSAAGGDVEVPRSSVRIDVLGGFKVTVDGRVLEPADWSGRRKAQALLAVVVAAGNSVDRARLVDGLWSGEDLQPSALDSRMWTLLSKVRSVIKAGSSAGADSKRALITSPSQIALQLGDADSTDIAEFRLVGQQLAAGDPRNLAAFEQLARLAAPLITGVPLDGVGGERIVTDWQQSLIDEVVETSTRLGRAWLNASSEPSAQPSDALLDVVRTAARLDPLDEAAALVLVELLVRARRGVDASRAFHRHRTQLDEALGMQPSRELVRAHAAAVELDGVVD